MASDRRDTGDAPTRRVVPARVGLVGNPSDGYGGAVVALPVPARAATVTVSAADGVHLRGAGHVDEWPSPTAWRHATAAGHHGEQRIISAALAVVADHAQARGVTPTGVTVTLSTTIPRGVGLAGSSALAVGVIDAVAETWGLRLDRRVLAALALAAERDLLGIAAGWQDRIVQAFGAPVLVDTARGAEVDGVSVPDVEVLDLAAWPSGARLVVGWRPGGGQDSGGYHGALRARADGTTVAPAVARAMADLATLARQAADALRGADLDALAHLVDAAWQRRQSVAPLHPAHAGLVESTRALGVAATTPGSGGAVVAVCPDPTTVARVAAALGADGVDIEVVDPRPTTLHGPM